MAPRIIVTGYGPFRDITDNPSDLIAQQVAARLRNTNLFSTDADAVSNFTVSVSHEGLAEFYAAADDTLNSPTLSHIVHIGVHAASTKVNFELVGYNVTSESGLAQAMAKKRAAAAAATNEAVNDDKEAEDLSSGKIDQSPLAQDLLPSTFPVHLDEFDDWMSTQTKAAWSRDAGWYYCNEIYYSTLLRVRKLRKANKERPLVKVIFVHVPLPEAVDIDTCAQLVVQFLEVDRKASEKESGWVKTTTNTTVAHVEVNGEKKVVREEKKTVYEKQ
ncbi:Pyroglutamyl-peptidase 1 [Rhizoclosmatium sp. JEL0117]|nr:Pyroglutamyl-peptidase 1 [Rhizoclosmatium sp. JEL0117]